MYGVTNTLILGLPDAHVSRGYLILLNLSAVTIMNNPQLIISSESVIDGQILEKDLYIYIYILMLFR